MLTRRFLVVVASAILFLCDAIGQMDVDPKEAVREEEYQTSGSIPLTDTSVLHHLKDEDVEFFGRLLGYGYESMPIHQNPLPTKSPIAKPIPGNPSPSKSPMAKPIPQKPPPIKSPIAKPISQNPSPTKSPIAKPISQNPSPTKSPMAKPTPQIPSPTKSPIPSGLFTERQIENMAAAFLKCYSFLDETTSDTSGIMGQDEYVTFLNQLTDDEPGFARFDDLPPIFVMIFNTAACNSGSDCIPGSRQQFEIGDTTEPNEKIQRLCRQTLISTFSTAQSTFEYFIQLPIDMIDEEDLANCLSTATANVLLDELAGCPAIPDVDSNNRERYRRIQNKERRQQRQIKGIGIAGTSGDSTCPYDINVSLDRFTELPCNEDQGTENDLCGVVQSTTTVTAPQLLEPFTLLLRTEMISIFRSAINSGTYPPPGTCLPS